MGEKDIRTKLNDELKKDIKEECQVVYILSRIRKILEINNQKGEYRYLNFYCNWVLHNKLDRANTTVLLKDLFEGDMDNSKSGKENAAKIRLNHNDFFKLHTLRRDLEGFFSRHNLLLELLNKNWESFLKLLLDIIKETPIIFTSSIIDKMELLRNDEGIYYYKFYLKGSNERPIIKLKIK